MAQTFYLDSFLNLVKFGFPEVALQLLDDAVDSQQIIFPCGTDDRDLLWRFVCFLQDEILHDYCDGAETACLVLARKINPALAESRIDPEQLEPRLTSFPLNSVRALLQRSIDGEHPLFNRWLSEELTALFKERKGDDVEVFCSPRKQPKRWPKGNQISFPLQ